MTTITKKTTLLRGLKRISISGLMAVSNPVTPTVSFDCANLPGTSGYMTGPQNSSTIIEVSVNGGEAQYDTIVFDTPDPTGLMVQINVPFSSGDTVKLTLNPDPEKADEYVQEKASVTAVAV